MSKSAARPWLVVALLILLAAPLTRCSLLSNGEDYLDGDEALKGLMALHVLQGQRLPLFPYGGSVGVSALETLVTVAFARALGLTPEVMQAAMLTLWCAGAMALALAAYQFAGGRAAVLTTALLVFCPAWLRVSVASWGYNLTAFLLGNLSLWLIAALHARRNRTRGSLALLGACVALTAMAQPIYALGLLPFLAWVLARRRLADLATFLGAAMAVTLLLLWARGLGEQAWAPALWADPQPLAALCATPRRLWVMFRGAYFLTQELPAGPAATTAGWVWPAALLGTAALVLLDRRRQQFTAVHAALLSIVAIVLFSLLIAPGLFAPRYLLPLVGYQCLAMGLTLDRLWAASAARDRRLLAAAGLALALLGAAAMVELGRINYSGTRVTSAIAEPQALEALRETLLARGVRHVYVTDAMLQWKVVFFMREQVLARWAHPSDRYPPYPRAVDDALYAGQPVAILHEASDPEPTRRTLTAMGHADLAVELVAERYVLVWDPPPALLAELFELNAPGGHGSRR